MTVLREAIPSTSSIASTTLAEGIALISSSALFAGLTREECSLIASCSRSRLFTRDEMLFMQGHPVKGLMLLQTGSVKLTQISSAGDEVILWINGRGDAVGLNCRECPCSSHTCSARALETCKVLTWECSRIHALFVAYPQIRTNINQMLNDRLKEIEERFREVATEKVAKRLAMTLLRLMKKVGSEHHAGVQISLSREELAQMTGTTLFTISRVLSKWRDMGLVLPRREAVVVLDPARLEEIGEEDSSVDVCSAADSDF